MSIQTSPAATGAGLQAVPPASQPGADRLTRLAAEGVAVWLDDIRCDRLASGSLAELVHTRHVTGVTSNPTIFATALSNGTAYGKQLAELAALGATAGEAARLITTRDIRSACGVLRPSTTRPAAPTARCRWKSIPGSLGTPRARSPKPATCGAW
jgi:transaldolase